MKPLPKITAALLALGLAQSALRAQDEAKETPLNSGPAVGTALTPVKCYATNGSLSGQEFDAAAKLGNAPCAFLFIHELTRNTAPVLRGCPRTPLSRWSTGGLRHGAVRAGATAG